MENKQTIKKYALSLYQVGKKNNVLDEIQKGLHLINSLYASTNTFRYFLLTKKIADNDKKIILSSVLKNYCSHYVIEFIAIVLENGHIQSLNPIIERFFIIANNESDIVNVKIITSNKLTDAELNSLSNDIQNQLSKRINATNEVDFQIIGGVKLMVGNKVIDGSISHQLKKIKQILEQV